MKQAWEKGPFEGHIEGVKNGQTTLSGKVPVVLSGAKSFTEQKPSGNSSDHPDKTFHPGGGQTPLLLTPASLQLAQLQAQLTLHRLKLAQSAVSGNTAAATVLNQVLSNVAMSQPLFNQLRSSTIVSTPHGQAGGAQLGPRFPTGSLTYQPQSSGLGALVGGGFGCGGNVQSINPGSFRPNCYGGSQGHSDYGKKAGPASSSTFSADSDRRAQYGFLSGTSAPGGKPNDGQYVPISSQAESGNQGSFQRDFFGSDGQSQQPGFSGQRNSDSFSSGRHTEQWHSVGNFSYTGKLDMAPSVGSAGSVWAPSGQQFNVRSELYNPEEPTTDPKYNSVGGPAFGPGAQGFMGYQPGEEGLSGVPTPLLPHQLNDFHAVTPSHLPHHCTICDKKVYNLKDWDQHVKGKLHLQNRSLYVEGPAAGSVHYPPSTESCLTSSANNSMAHATAANQDASPGTSTGFLPAAQMTSHPAMGAGYPLPPPTGSKFIQRKSSPGRVVHICNLPEGSCTENDVINLGLPFGKVTNYILMRSTHQAFLEMAYIEAAQAMVQYYQLNPATVNDQKLLIRMSKRYQELQLKKPGKDVESIIQDINSQREREELQEIENYPPERARSRSPVSRSLSPHSHSPSFTSCSSAHSPPWGNGLGPRRASWDWSSHMRDEACWRNGDQDRPNGRLQDRRKPYLKPADRMSPRSVEEWAEGLRGGRDRYCKGSPQGPPFPSYRSKEEDFYKKEPAYKLDKLPRPPYQRHEMKPKRRDLPEHHRSRHLEPEAPEDSEDRKLTPPLRGRSKKSTWKQEVEKDERGSESYGDKAGEPQAKEKSGLPAQTEHERDKDSEEEEWKSGDEKEEESWYPKNMEELVTVDEVGEEDDGLIEPDLPDLLEQTSVKDEDRASTQTAASEASKKEVLQCETGLKDPAGPEPHLQESQEGAPPNEDPQQLPNASKQPTSKLRRVPSQDSPAPLEEMSSSTDGDKPHAQSPKDCPANHKDACDGAKPVQRETGKIELSAKAQPSEILRRDEGFGETPKKETTQSQTDVVAKPVPLTSLEQDKTISEHSIPLGVEFIVPRSGFYCKLCDLFYTSEETAKTAHCRSTVHYRNLRKYLSQLAEESLPDTNSEPAGAE